MSYQPQISFITPNSYEPQQSYEAYAPEVPPCHPRISFVTPDQVRLLQTHRTLSNQSCIFGNSHQPYQLHSPASEVSSYPLEEPTYRPQSYAGLTNPPRQLTFDQMYERTVLPPTSELAQAIRRALAPYSQLESLPNDSPSREQTSHRVIHVFEVPELSVHRCKDPDTTQNCELALQLAFDTESRACEVPLTPEQLLPHFAQPLPKLPTPDCRRKGGIVGQAIPKNTKMPSPLRTGKDGQNKVESNPARTDLDKKVSLLGQSGQILMPHSTGAPSKSDVNVVKNSPMSTSKDGAENAMNKKGSLVGQSGQMPQVSHSAEAPSELTKDNLKISDN